MAISTYPVRVDASLDPNVSRWLWLMKWALAFPHYIALAFLWVAFVVASVAAFFAIVFTGRYPPSLFDFNVGVLRWSWRVHYYTFGALATDQYPPFTLENVAEYPAHLEITYPQHLSRGLVWVKWWLLAIPHYLVVGIFVGGGSWAAWRLGNWTFDWAPGGLLGVLVLIAAVSLLVTGRYPRQIFDLVLGLNRWVLRVAAYAGLMTDDYPPFRLDMGGHDPSDTLTLPSPPPPAPPVIKEWPNPQIPTPRTSPRRGWTGGRITELVAGSFLGLISLGLLAGGGVTAWADNTQRDGAGYMTTGAHSFSTSSYALTSGNIELGSSADLFGASEFLGTVRLRVTPASTQSNVFVGIASEEAVSRLLTNVNHEEITDWTKGTTVYHGGSATPVGSPAQASIWTLQSAGKGSQTLIWNPGPGNWTAVVMNIDAQPGLAVTADVGATIPDLGWISIGLLAGGALLVLAAGALILTPIIRASR